MEAHTYHNANSSEPRSFNEKLKIGSPRLLRIRMQNRDLSNITLCHSMCQYYLGLHHSKCCSRCWGVTVYGSKWFGVLENYLHLHLVYPFLTIGFSLASFLAFLTLCLITSHKGGLVLVKTKQIDLSQIRSIQKFASLLINVAISTSLRY